MSQDRTATDDPRAATLVRYETQLAFYERTKKDARRLFYALQVVVIVASAITPVLILISVEKWVQAAVPTVAAIGAALQATFQYRESWLRRARAAEALKSEYHLYLT